MREMYTQQNQQSSQRTYHHHHHHQGRNKTKMEDDDPSSHYEINSRFIIDQILGKGAFATVYRARTRKRRKLVRNNHDVWINSSSSNSNGQKERQSYSKDDSGSTPETYVSLKVVNVSKVTKKRRQEQENLHGGMMSHISNHDYQGNANNNNCNESSSILSTSQTEYDTEQLFFPSRIQNYSKNQNLNKKKKNQNKEEEDDDQDFVRTRMLLQREISVHLNVSKSNHPNIVSMLESFEYNKMVIGTSRNIKKEQNLIMAMVIEYCPLGDLHQYLKRKRNERRNKDEAVGEEEECGTDNTVMNQEEKQKHQQSYYTSFIDEQEIRHAMRQIFRGVAFLHSRGIVHRDIKAANIFLTPKNCMNKEMPTDTTTTTVDSHSSPTSSFSLHDCCLKIGDFGLAVQMSDDDDWDDAQHTLCGTPSCLAPEVALSSPTPASTSMKQRRSSLVIQSLEDESLLINKDDPEIDVRGHGQPADLWSIGCILYVMLFGTYPFSTCRNIANDMNRRGNNMPLMRKNNNKAMKIRETIQSVIRGTWTIPQHFRIQNTSKKLLSQLLSRDPKYRGFARGILSSHIFFQGSDHIQMKYLKIPEKRSSQLKAPEQQDKLDHSLLLRSNTTLFRDQARAMDVIRNRQTKREHEKSLLLPMKGLHMLPVLKHEWKMEKRSNVSSDRKNITLSLFVLPEQKGIVFQCEKIGGSGVWMHLTGDGKRILVGKLSKYPSTMVDYSVKNGDCSILNEAFSRVPRKYKYCYDPDKSNINNCWHGSNEHQTMCTFGQANNTSIISRTMNSMSFSVGAKRRKCKHKRISSLLRDKNCANLTVYKTLEKCIKRLRKNLPKIHLSIYSGEIMNDAINSNQLLLCIVTLTEGGSNGFINIQFVDGSKISYDRSNGFTKLSAIGKDGTYREVVNLYINKNESLSQFLHKLDSLDKGRDEAIVSYLQFARSAIRKCINLDAAYLNQCSNITIPVIKLCAVKGKSYRSWIDITDQGMTMKRRKLFEEHIVKRSLNCYLEKDLMHPLGPKFRL